MPPWLSLDLELRGRTEGQTSFNQEPSNDRVYELTRVRGGAEVRPTSFLTGYLQFQDTHALGLPLSQVASNMRNTFDLFQGYVDFHVRNVHLITGRQQLRYGNERLVGVSDWSNNSRSWDGFRAHIGTKEDFLELFSTSVVTVHPTSHDTHGAGLTFHGAVGSVSSLIPSTQLLPFVFISTDRSVANEQSIKRPELETTFGAEGNGKLPGGLEYDLLGALQRGSDSNSSIHAGAAVLQVAYRASTGPWKPRATFEYDYATGDSHRSPKRVSTFDQLNPSNHNAFGLVDIFGFQNIRQERLNLDLAPAKSLTLLVQAESLHLVSLRDDVYARNGSTLLSAPSAGFSADDIGQGFDVSGSYALGSSLNLQAGVGHLFPGRVLAEGGTPSPVTLGYLQLRYRFNLERGAHGMNPGQF